MSRAGVRGHEPPLRVRDLPGQAAALNVLAGLVLEEAPLQVASPLLGDDGAMALAVGVDEPPVHVMDAFLPHSEKKRALAGTPAGIATPLISAPPSAASRCNTGL